ncbi:protein imuA [Phenylobacterium sp.]|uniref:ImuA family protein n=1 Tax=Phenylobacterium sp. TaxID=1871053 RepID=UPI00301C4966
MSPARAPRIAALAARIARIEGGVRSDVGGLAFGVLEIDACLPGGGLPLGRWHEVAADGMETELSAAPVLFAALAASPLARRGEAVWVFRRDDLWAPGLSGLGFPAERLVQVWARDEAEVLGVMEDALATPGVSVVFGEAGTVDLTAGRRLQLACERRGTTGFVLDRRPFGGEAKRLGPGTASATRWRVASAPSAKPAEGVGLGAPRLAVTLERCRGGRPGAWILEAACAYGGGPGFYREASDDAHPLRLVAPLGDRELATAGRRAA